MAKSEQKTNDAEENDALMKEDAKWGTGARGKKAEGELRKKGLKRNSLLFLPQRITGSGMMQWKLMSQLLGSEI